jgi:hypothetical protein
LPDLQKKNLIYYEIKICSARIKVDASLENEFPIGASQTTFPGKDYSKNFF